MTKVCSECGEELKEGFFSSAKRCKECKAYLCDDCARETGRDVYCKNCFKDARD